MVAITREQERNALAGNLKRLLEERSMNQSDLAKVMWPGKFVIDNRGYKQPINKDRISAWVNGKAFPNKEHLALLLEILNVTDEVLLGKQKQFLPKTSHGIRLEATGEDAYALIKLLMASKVSTP